MYDVTILSAQSSCVIYPNLLIYLHITELNHLTWQILKQTNRSQGLCRHGLHTDRVITLNPVPKYFCFGQAPWISSIQWNHCSVFVKRVPCRIDLASVFWGEPTGGNQPPIVSTQHGVHWLLLLIHSYFQSVDSLWWASSSAHSWCKGSCLWDFYFINDGLWIVSLTIHGSWTLV